MQRVGLRIVNPLEGVPAMKPTTPSCGPVLLTIACLLLSGCGTSGLNFNFKAEKVEKETADNPVDQSGSDHTRIWGPGLFYNPRPRGALRS
jgi:hypothetical protein